jgi:Rne/Rng family ribonuclease
MAKEICISSTPHETRLAILEDDQLAEIYYERENEYTLAGSIYNGRVTRVLPGMQSAFVDLGLERDAFLYVTDFLELEDQEESDELEKAAAAGGNQPPREVRRGVGQRQESRPESRPDRQESRPEARPDRPERPSRGDRDRRAAAAPETPSEAAPAEQSGPEIPALTGHLEPESEQEGEGGAKRWRGRRRRRGGRAAPTHVSDPVESEASAETYLEPSELAESEVAPEIHAASSAATEMPAVSAASAPRIDRAPAPFVLPGESLSKYGGERVPETARTEPSAPPRPASTFKPASLIETPLAWDGSGLLPGESISRHRRHEPEPETSTGMDGEPQGVFADALHAGPVEEDFIEESVEYAPAAGGQAVWEPASGAAIETTEVEPEEQLNTEELVMKEQPEEPLPGAHAATLPPEVTVHHPTDEDLSAGTPNPEQVVADPFASDPFFAGKASPAETPEEHTARREFADSESAARHTVRGSTASFDEPPHASESEGHESNRSASHHVDPLPPSEFRLSSLFGGKKKSDEPAPPAEPLRTEPEPATVKSVSAFAPGKGVVEEEVIEGEEFEAPRHHHRGKPEEHDLDEYEEEEKLHTQIRSGELGEMLQEAHLDHRIQMNFEDKAAEVEGEEVYDIEDEEEDEPADAETVPAGNGAPTPQRRERGGRGRRGGRGPQDRTNRRGGPSRRSAQTSDLPIISDLLKPGQEILVQIAKEPIAKKGARITSHIALPGRFLVFMPTVTHVGVSRKISSDEERARLKRILTSERGESGGGFIVRTAAEGASEEELRSDLRFLIHLWEEIKQRSENSKSPALIYHDLSLIERILRDQISANFSAIWVDTEADYERIVRFLNRFAPSMVRRVKLYTKETPLFEHFGIQDEISKALRSKVWLKSGGSIVINQTEALVAIDINTGKYVGKTARLEDTIVKTNLDAIPEIVRQIRLRDLGGIIIIDFIDMDERKNRFRVMAALEEALKNDRAPTKVLQFNDFGLVAITRKRVKQSLERTLSVPCPTCQATGMVKSPSTVANEIYIELRKMRKHFENSDVVLRVNPETVKILKSNNAHWLTEFEELIGKNILVKSDPALHPEQFDIQG